MILWVIDSLKTRPGDALVARLLAARVPAARLKVERCEPPLANFDGAEPCAFGQF